jgi:hypothetical protein
MRSSASVDNRRGCEGRGSPSSGGPAPPRTCISNCVDDRRVIEGTVEVRVCAGRARYSMTRLFGDHHGGGVDAVLATLANEARVRRRPPPSPSVVGVVHLAQLGGRLEAVVEAPASCSKQAVSGVRLGPSTSGGMALAILSPTESADNRAPRAASRTAARALMVREGDDLGDVVRSVAVRRRSGSCRRGSATSKSMSMSGILLAARVEESLRGRPSSRWDRAWTFLRQ